MQFSGQAAAFQFSLKKLPRVASGLFSTGSPSTRSFIPSVAQELVTPTGTVMPPVVHKVLHKQVQEELAGRAHLYASAYAWTKYIFAYDRM